MISIPLATSTKIIKNTYTRIILAILAEDTLLAQDVSGFFKIIFSMQNNFSFFVCVEILEGIMKKPSQKLIHTSGLIELPT